VIDVLRRPYDPTAAMKCIRRLSMANLVVCKRHEEEMRLDRNN
jgi:hypothetical protein